MSSPTPMLVVTNEHTGCTLFTHLLKANPDILMFSELLNRNEIQWDYPEFETKAYNSPQMRAIRDVDPVHFIKSVYVTTSHSNYICVGFKVLYKHFAYSPQHQKLIPHILNHRDIKILHLKKSNGFEMFCDRQIAMKRANQSLTIKRPVELDPPMSLTLDREDCLHFLKQIARDQAYFDKVFAERNVLDVSFEELVKDPTEVMGKVQKYLGVPPRRITANPAWLDRQPYETMIVNYAELAEFLTEKGYGHLFEAA